MSGNMCVCFIVHSTTTKDGPKALAKDTVRGGRIYSCNEEEFIKVKNTYDDNIFI